MFNMSKETKEKLITLGGITVSAIIATLVYTKEMKNKKELKQINDYHDKLLNQILNKEASKEKVPFKKVLEDYEIYKSSRNKR